MVMVLQDLQKRRGNKITAQSAGIVVVYICIRLDIFLDKILTSTFLKD